jgi:hypothetical protein
VNPFQIPSSYPQLLNTSSKVFVDCWLHLFPGDSRHIASWKIFKARSWKRILQYFAKLLFSKVYDRLVSWNYDRIMSFEVCTKQLKNIVHLQVFYCKKMLKVSLNQFSIAIISPGDNFSNLNFPIDFKFSLRGLRDIFFQLRNIEIRNCILCNHTIDILSGKFSNKKSGFHTVTRIFISRIQSMPEVHPNFPFPFKCIQVRVHYKMHVNAIKILCR